MSQVDWISVSDFYDIPLAGWMRVDGKRLYFRTEGQEKRVVYECDDRALKLAHLRYTRLFRNMVGWHFDYCPRTPWQQRPSFDPSKNRDWEKYYDLPKLERLHSLRRVGRTDLLEVEWDSPEPVELAR